jgi:hypothetical protein
MLIPPSKILLLFHEHAHHCLAFVLLLAIQKLSKLRHAQQVSPQIFGIGI